MRAVFQGTLILALCAPFLALAQPTAAEHLATLRQTPEANHAEGALTQASRALEEAQRRREAGDAAGAERADRIARAALKLADRQIALVRARAALREAIQARDEARRRQAVAEGE